MNKLIAFAMDFSSYLIEHIKKPVAQIILFGSAARGEAGKKSDVDLFIEASKSSEKDIKKILDKFYESSRYKNYWRLKEVENQIKPIIGRLEEWKDLKNSIISDGITLYGKFTDLPKKGVHKTIFSWENLKPESKRVLVSKKIFGYKKGKKAYKGLVQKYSGERIGKGTIIVPDKYQKLFVKYFRDMKVAVRIRKVLEYS